MRDPNDDDSRYCSRCLRLLNPDTDYPREPDEVVGCRYCHAGVLIPIRHDQMLTKRAIRRADWAGAREDGLIL